MYIQNPTQLELKKIKGIIYLIRNKITKQGYIGLAKNGFYDRYTQNGGWWKSTGNIHLKRAAYKYGIDKFEIIILDSDIPEKHLDSYEEYAIALYGTLAPNGYNFLPGGGSTKHHKETRLKMATTNRNGIPVKLKNHRTGEVFEVMNLAEFCRQRNLSRTMMTNISTSKYKRHKEYTLVETELRKWKVQSPDGILSIILEGELNSFCREFGLHRAGISKICNGTFKQYKGWVCPDIN
ncbi:MAG: GIY-YIG nuclease family protein [bacterium]|nr:GIY-YIG nuclease family protein [bacterium]